MAKKTNPSRFEKIMDGLGVWVSFYRCFPNVFAKEYLNMTWLKKFQELMIIICFNFTYVLAIASRGLGKSQIMAAVCVLKCILYPGLKICIAAGNRGQSLNVLKKIIEDFCPQSANLRGEILTQKVTPADAYIIFKNNSSIRVVTSRDSARSARAHIILGDEFPQIPKSILDKVIRKFKAGQRTPKFYENPKYKDIPKEPNSEIYISSATFKFHYAWKKMLSFFKSMMKDESYITYGFPYQLPVSEGYYPAEQIREEMQEDDFDAVSFSMEMESLFFGEAANAFFNYNDLNNARKILTPIYPQPYYQLLNDSKMKFPNKQNGEIRLLSMDIATAGGLKNDNSCITLLQMLPSSNGQFIRNILYIETMNGGHTYTQSIRLRQLYDDLEADFVVIDSNGVGISVFDNLVKEQFDEERGVTYPSWSCVNDTNMAERSQNPSQNKIIYSIKATQQLNSDAAAMFRDGLRRGKIRLLADENEAGHLERNKHFRALSSEDQALYKLPYCQTTLLIHETINLSYKVVNNKIRVEEASNMRKDRYSSASYANYIASEIERDVKPKQTLDVSSIMSLGRKATLYKYQK